jgi:putative ABC transport system permease protein
VVRRNHEIGIRLALGAPPDSVTRLFVAEGVMMLIVGSGIGITAAAAAGRVIQSLLFGVRSSDVPSYILGALPLVVTGLLASVLPARRAAQVDPLITIRDS